MEKAVIFDFGNVIYSFDNRTFLKNISRFSDKTFDELDFLVYRSSDLLQRYETGLVSTDEIVKRIMDDCNLKMSKDEFMRAYFDIFIPIPSTLELIRKLKAGYKLGLLSNTGELPYERIIKTCEVFPLFDAVTASFKVKAMKPAEKIYRDALNKLKLEPEECVYIDDIEEYSDAATKLGMHGIHYAGHGNLVKRLKQLKVLD